jgi:hypothetical protein
MARLVPAIRGGILPRLMTGTSPATTSGAVWLG